MVSNHFHQDIAAFSAIKIRVPEYANNVAVGELGQVLVRPFKGVVLDECLDQVRVLEMK